MNSEEKLAKDKEAVASMRAAQKNMTVALERINELEGALTTCADRLGMAAKLLTGYGYDSRLSLEEKFRGFAEEAKKIL
jgi:hypothetical protein